MHLDFWGAVGETVAARVSAVHLVASKVEVGPRMVVLLPAHAVRAPLHALLN